MLEQQIRKSAEYDERLAGIADIDQTQTLETQAKQIQKLQSKVFELENILETKGQKNVLLITSIISAVGLVVSFFHFFI